MPDLQPQQFHQAWLCEFGEEVDHRLRGHRPPI
jgi:hypothetical protein